HEAALDPARRTHHDAPREREVAIDPRVEQHAAVDLDADLVLPGALELGVGLDAEVRRVGVRADQSEPALLRRSVADLQGSDGRARPDDVHAITGRDAPSLGLVEAAIASGFEP